MKILSQLIAVKLVLMHAQIVIEYLICERNMSEAKARIYEHLLLLQHSTPVQEVSRVVDAASKILSASGGIIMRHETWGLKDLAYKISRCSKAHFVLMYMNCTPQAHMELCSKLSLNPDVIRGFFRKLKSLPSGQSPILCSIEASNEQAASASQVVAGNQMGGNKTNVNAALQNAAQQKNSQSTN